MKAGDRTETGVTALGHGGSIEYLDVNGTKYRRRWNHDGTQAVDDLLTEAEFKEATKPVASAAPVPTAVPAGMPASSLKLSAAQEEAIAKYKASQPQATAMPPGPVLGKPTPPFTPTQAGAAPKK